jgi:eukaryotic-like serine/threonine-protein kinase
VPLKAGARLGAYEIVSRLGTGGMGEVYQARDTRLGRSVAIKILPDHLATDPERRVRFEREARVVSSLNHPHICTLHDIGCQDGIDFLVMERIEGETLSDRLRKGPLELGLALRYGVEISDALDKAHRQGVVHRDLKPGNIMITKPGVKILDFGLAKFLQQENNGPSASESSTREQPLTDAGVILGTVQYMAPEQLEGKEADARADIFAFGEVLYEMVSGRKAFEGKSQASLIAAILNEKTPLISRERPLTPASLDHLVERCLAKEPDERWQTASDVMRELAWIAEERSKAATPARGRSRGRLGWGVALLLLLALLPLAYQSRQKPTRERLTLSVLPPEGTRFVAKEAPTLSPDGRELAFVASDASGESRIWIRPLNSLEPRRLEGSEGASYPFWSPDGRFLAFFARGALYKVAASGGPPQKLCPVGNARGGTWSSSGTILLTPRSEEALYQLPATGGEPKKVTALDLSSREVSHRWPYFLPDGRRFLYLSAAAGRPGIFLGSLDGDEKRRVQSGNTSAILTVSGYMLFMRGDTIVAQRVDPVRGEPSGEPLPVAEKVMYDPDTRLSLFSASENVLAYRRGETTSPLRWIDRKGKELGRFPPQPGAYRDATLSRDGRMVAAARWDEETGAPDVWLLDISRGISTRLTHDAAGNFFPVWSPDGRFLVFNSNQQGAFDLYRVPLSGNAEAELILKSDTLKIPTSWSPDGRHIAFHSPGLRGDWDLWVLSLPDGAAAPFVQTQFDEREGHFSPDSRWIAYASNETGRSEVYVQSFPSSGFKMRVSLEGGREPRWRGDGKELFYLAADGYLMSVPVTTGGSFQADAPRALFDTPWDSWNLANTFMYDVTPNADRFLFAAPIGEDADPAITVILNWSS